MKKKKKKNLKEVGNLLNTIFTLVFFSFKQSIFCGFFFVSIACKYTLHKHTHTQRWNLVKRSKIGELKSRRKRKTPKQHSVMSKYFYIHSTIDFDSIFSRLILFFLLRLFHLSQFVKYTQREKQNSNYPKLICLLCEYNLK